MGLSLMDRTVFDLVIIGGGPAGMAAALGAANHSSKVLLIERASVLGGILNQCTHKGFGLGYFGEDLTGQEYAQRFISQIRASNVVVLTGTTVMAIGIDRKITISGADIGYKQIRAGAIILATGCRERPIGTLPIAGSRPSGIFAAGAAQKMLNLGGYDIGDDFVILGSGDVGMIVARELALRGKNVIAVIEKEAACGGMERNRINCLERYNIPLITNATISEVHGSSRVTGVTLTKDPNVSSYIKCDTLITSLGLVPERDLLDSLLKRVPSTDPELPEWLYICGNADYVHDIVDGVSFESERIGRRAIPL